MSTLLFSSRWPVLAIVSEHFEIDDLQLFAAKRPMALCYADTSAYPQPCDRGM